MGDATLAKRNDVRARLAKGLAALKADIVHAGIFDFAGMFRERRLRRKELLDGAATAVFANVLPKWDIAENIMFPGPYGSETIAYDPDSLRVFPFEPGAAALVADYTGPQEAIMPRQILRVQIEKAAERGFEVEAAFEFEFLALNETAESLRDKNFAGLDSFAPENRCWSGQTAAVHAEFVGELESMLRYAGIDPYALGGELGPGCFEVTLRHQAPMRAADDAAFFRLYTKAFCRRRNMTASFMPLLGEGFPGIGGHIVLSLRDRKTGRNLFADAERCKRAERDSEVVPSRRDRSRARCISDARPYGQRLSPPVAGKLGTEDGELGSLQLCGGGAYGGGDG